MKKPLTLLLLALSLLPVPLTAQTKEPALVFTHVTVIDVVSGRAKPDMTLVIEGAWITALGRSGKVKVPRGAQVIDASGKYLIPGLWDMHTHALSDNRYEWVFPLLIANGVTGVREMGNNLPFERTKQIRQEIREGKLLGPRLGAVTAKIINGPGLARVSINSTAVKTADEARQFVREYKQQGVDFIKPYFHLPRDFYLAIVDEAKRQKIPFAGHVPYSMSATEVSDLGQISIEHNTDMPISCSRDEAKLRQESQKLPDSARFTERQTIQQKALETFDEQKARALFARFVRNGTWMCPTIVFFNPGTLEESQLLGDDRLKYIPAPMQEQWRNGLKERIGVTPDIDNRKMNYEKRLEIVGLMHRTGVPLLAGSDAVNPYVFPGSSLHEELQLLVEAGLTPLAALQTATVNPAKFLGKEKEIGTIEKGKLADLVLLDANPLENISNTQRINAVVVNGRYLPQEALRKLLAEVEAAAKRAKPR